MLLGVLNMCYFATARLSLSVVTRQRTNIDTKTQRDSAGNPQAIFGDGQLANPQLSRGDEAVLAGDGGLARAGRQRVERRPRARGARPAATTQRRRRRANTQRRRVVAAE